MAGPWLSEHVDAALTFFRLMDDDERIRAFQAQPGGLLLCVECEEVLEAVSCQVTGNIESYECACGTDITAMEAYQDIARFKEIIGNIEAASK